VLAPDQTRRSKKPTEGRHRESEAQAKGVLLSGQDVARTRHTPGLSTPQEKISRSDEELGELAPA